MTLLAIDGNSILNRAFYGIKLLTTKDGRYTNAIYGFINILEKVKELYAPDRIAIAFDMRSPTFRHKAYSGYKANRKGMPPELAQQLPILKDLLSALGYTLIECEGYEADDILGTLSSACEKSGDKCIIVTGDRDSLQLVGSNVSVSLATTKMGHAETTLYTEKEIMEEYGVLPIELIDIKAIQGDASDCIPGVAGIGKKGAGELIQKYHSIDYIYENLDALDIRESMKLKLIEGKDSAFMSRMLGEIVKDVPIDLHLDSYNVKPADNNKAAEIMTELQLFSQMKKLNINFDENRTANKEAKEVISLEYKECMSFPDNLTDAYFMAEDDENNISIYLTYDKCLYKITPSDSDLKVFFENENIKKYTDSTKQLYHILDKFGIQPKGISFDVTLAAYLLDPSSNSYSLELLCKLYNIDLPTISCEEDMSAKEVQKLRVYGAIAQLCVTLDKNIKEFGMDMLLHEVEIPLARVLADMEITGFGVDIDSVAKYGEMLDCKLNQLQKDIFNECGYEFNLNSPKQLGEALFEKLGLPHSGKKTKRGYSTSADVLEELKYTHPVIPMVIEFRALAKLKSTYCDGLKKVVGDDGRIHSCFNQTETRTGRISSIEPNMQNIPVRTPQGKELRRFFTAKDGYVLIDADYSQIELRVLAHMANDKNMVDGFLSGDDIHAITASQVFGLPLNMVNNVMRSRAKAVNFGIVYGIGAFSLSKDIGVTKKEADNYIKAYLNHYSGIDTYMQNVLNNAKQDGYVSTIFGRRRYLPELKSSNFMQRAFGERVARNMPIQGTAADIIKIAMIRVANRLKAENLKSKLILQVHDELIVEAPENEKDKVRALLQEEMENAVKLNVPLPVDSAIGKTWYEAKA